MSVLILKALTGLCANLVWFPGLHLLLLMRGRFILAVRYKKKWEI